MNKKAVLFIVTVILGIVGYMIYGYINQKNKDHRFRDDCAKNPAVNIPLTFVLNSTENIPQLELHLKRAGKTLNKIIVKNLTGEYEYTDGFSIQDTIEIVHQEKIYKIYNFEYHAVTINSKKGPECMYKGAFINKKWNEGGVFELK